MGLDDEEPMTLEKVGRRIGLTRERVRQIERAAVASLRELMGETTARRQPISRNRSATAGDRAMKSAPQSSSRFCRGEARHGLPQIR
jgi:hypothetical protein